MEHQRIRELRRSLGLSQERFAQLLSVSLQTVRRWENGLTRPLPIISMKLEEMEREARRAIVRRGDVSTDDEGRRRGQAVDIDAGLGGLFKGLGGLFSLVSTMAEEGKTELRRTGKQAALGGTLKAIYGFNVRMGTGGTPVIERFGNVQETESGTIIVETREPLVDVLDEGEHLVVILELPGVEEEDIRLQVHGDVLEVAAATGRRRYQKEVLLPAAVEPGSLKTSHQNGILEIQLAKAQKA